MNRVSTAETVGSRTMSQAFSTNQLAAIGAAASCPITSPLPLEEVHLVDVDRLPVPVDQDPDRQAEAPLRRRDGDHEQGEHLPRQRAQRLAERHQVDVHGVQHQLDRHQHEDAVPPGQHAVDADREQGRREEQDDREPDHVKSSLRDSTMAPISAPRRRNDTASNGKTYRLKIDSPTAAAPPVLGSIFEPSHEKASWIRKIKPARMARATTIAAPRRWLSRASRPIGALVSIRPKRNRITIAPT